MSKIEDYYEALRRFLVPRVGHFLRKLESHHNYNLYVEGDIYQKEYVGAVDMSEDEFETFLQEQGFEPNPLAAFKTLGHEDGGEEGEEGSWRWVPDEDEYFDSRFQLHVRIYDGSAEPNASSDRTYAFAHWEYRWDVAPYKHYRGVDKDSKRGVDMMRGMLDSHDVSYDTEEPDFFDY